MTNPNTITLQDVQEAERRIRPYCDVTPLLESPLLSSLLGFRLWLKAENTHAAGAFKVRGAFNHMLQLTPEQKKRGVAGIPSGNHAQAVAYAAQLFGVDATIVMPQDAPAQKLANTRAYGAEVITYDREKQDREAIGQELATAKGLTFIHPYDDARTIAGQGTIGLEIHRQCRDKNISPDAVIISCSGGGMAAGISLSGSLYAKPPQFFTAEPADFNDAERSLTSGAWEKNAKLSGSICDALLAAQLGKLTLPLLQQAQTQGLSASDEAVMMAMHMASTYFNQKLEPGGAVALACALMNREKFQGKNIVVIGSGGNVDPGSYVKMLERGQTNVKQLLPGLALA